MDDEHPTTQLKRIAFGAGATDAEREAALRELAASAGGASAQAAPTAEHAEAEHAGSEHLADAPESDASQAPPEAAAAERGSRTWTRITVIAAASALLVGGVVGWQLGAATGGSAPGAPTPGPTPGASAEPRTQAEYLESLEFAGDTEAAKVFSREAVPSDEPPFPARFDEGNGVPAYRLLATRSDGVQIFGSRDDVDLCVQVFMVSTDVGAREAMGGGACTENGRFPEEGLEVEFPASGAFPRLAVTWSADGTVTLDSVVAE
ncbi:hypothetical protein [Agromyces sp. LHK192]|uniref:hypothetical protein n=1 Tax=Agromyces sp. LHK192 TaxID=2498704 RepID=UPI000FDC8293|nr:hypothetical protein [Agromyces sp. LHK192]